MPDPGLNDPRIGVQLIVYGKRAVEDFPLVLQEVKETGYDGVETGNLYNRYTKDELKAMLDATGLSITGCHAGFGDFTDPEKVKSSIQFLQDVGAKYLMVSGVGSHDEGLAAYDSAAELFNRVGRQCREEGITFCYHNHAWEFDLIDGTVPMHYLCANTDSDAVKLCIDVYWVYIGGDDPAEFIRRYADRAAYFHFKDGSKGVFSELGRGQVDFDSLMPEVRNVSPEWIVYEQDRTDLEPRESLDISRKFLHDRLAL
jgi:sugar phosphate isomerase/epimerase